VVFLRETMWSLYRRGGNALAALKNFVRSRKTAFSTLSEPIGQADLSVLDPGTNPIGGLALVASAIPSYLSVPPWDARRLPMFN
jgi:hypothetical protein